MEFNCAKLFKCIFSLVRRIESNEKRVIEGELRCRELAVYLDQLKTEKVVWISEDATAIIVKVNYDPVTNQIIGLVLPLGNNGCPITLAFEANTASEIQEHMKKQKSSIVYLVMAQPLDEKLPPFILQLFGSANSFTAQDVLNRWQYTQSELAKHGIRIAGISSDGDPRLLSAMCCVLTNASANSSFNMPVVQDPTHIATKLRNRLLKPDTELQMGNEKVSVKHLIALINRCPKEIHGLSLSDVSPEDRQNFASFQKITTTRVLNVLKVYVQESRGTVKYLKLCHDVVSSYMDFDMTPIDRIIRNWSAAYFFRIWKEYIRNSKYRMDEKFITHNAFKCIEVNSRNLLILIRKFRDNNTPHLFVPTLFQSQTCEKIFRQFRSMGTVNFTKINFSILELLYMIRRVEVQNNILHFKLVDKGVVFPKFQVESRKTKIYSLPSDHEIELALHQAKMCAVEEAKKFGMNIDEQLLENYPFEQKSVLTVDNDYDSDYFGEDSNYDPSMEIDENYKNGVLNENIDSDEQQENSKFVQVSTEDGSQRIMRKSSLVWLLSEKGSQLSKDRLKRVQSTSASSRPKRARRVSEK